MNMKHVSRTDQERQAQRNWWLSKLFEKVNIQEGWASLEVHTLEGFVWGMVDYETQEILRELYLLSLDEEIDKAFKQYNEG